MHQATAVSAADTKTIIYLFIKRLVDIVGGLVGLIILLPIALIIKIVSMCNGDFDKIIFVQKRIGKNGQEFDFYKFRSMVPNADEVLFKMLEENKEVAKEYQENKKLKEGIIKSIVYIKSCGRFKNLYSMFLDESYISNYGTVELLNMLKEVLK